MNTTAGLVSPLLNIFLDLSWSQNIVLLVLRSLPSNLEYPSVIRSSNSSVKPLSSIVPKSCPSQNCFNDPELRSTPMISFVASTSSSLFSAEGSWSNLVERAFLVYRNNHKDKRRAPKVFDDLR
jgi:hypothetical protein